MFTKLLFGVENSPQRKICVVLAVVLAVIGVIIVVSRGLDSDWTGVLMGLAFIALGLCAVAVMSRQFAAHDAKVATSEQLGRLSGEFDNSAIQQMADRAKDDPNVSLSRVTGQLDAQELQATIDQVRKSS